ncbi:hypothetical protein MRQ47_004448 [Salmonella enterica]|nr:hypothetical protein [Salmonella enterica]
MKRLALLALAVTTLAGCSTFADKMARCKSYGITPDTCAKIIMQERQQMIAAGGAYAAQPVQRFQPVQYPSYALPVNIAQQPQPVQQNYAQPMPQTSYQTLPQVQARQTPNFGQKYLDQNAQALQDRREDMRAGMIINALKPAPAPIATHY